MNIPSFANIKSQLDEARAQYYPRNETERKVYEALSSKNWYDIYFMIELHILLKKSCCMLNKK